MSSKNTFISINYALSSYFARLKKEINKFININSNDKLQRCINYIGDTKIMEILLVPIFKTLISEGLKAIFNPLKEKLYKYYKIKILSRSIMKMISNYIESKNYDFEGYLEIVINSNLLANISDPNLLETIEDVLKTRFFNKLDGHNIIDMLKEKLKQNTFLSMEFLKEKLTLDFFFDLFGDPRLNEQGNEKKKKVVESIWKAFNIEALKVVKTKDVIIDMYIGLQGDMKEIKSFMRNYIATRAVKDDKSERRKIIYNKLWQLLVELQFAADELWSKATVEGIAGFISIYKEVFKEIKKEKYNLRSDHKRKLVELLYQFELYHDGKSLVVNVKCNPIDNYDNNINIHVEKVLGPIIENNRKIRDNYLKLLSEISDYFDEILLES